jgi:hypothetical protein
MSGEIIGLTRAQQAGSCRARGCIDHLCEITEAA